MLRGISVDTDNNGKFDGYTLYGNLLFSIQLDLSHTAARISHGADDR